MARTPTFAYMGGKCRLRKWLIQHFPQRGGRYIEPFAGVGNVFFLARKELEFKAWILSDINGFLDALRVADLNRLPLAVSREDFQRWKTAGCAISKLIEPRITFGGKGYNSGFSVGSLNHPAYRGDCYKPICEEARRLISSATIKQCCWTAWDYASLTPDDFVYFDPPYLGTKASYPNIDHALLIALLNSLECRWAVSGYDNELYETHLNYVCKHERVRNSEIKSSNTGKYEAVCETLWTNYPAEGTSP